METSIRLYSLDFDNAKTYLWAAVFVVCNMLLPQVFHLIPQGGVIFSPLSLVILVGAYKFGWKTGLMAALLSPLANHVLTGLPAWGVLLVMTLKLAILAVVAGVTAQYFQKVSLFLIVSVVIVSMSISCLGEKLITGGINATIADITIGWPGLLMQIFGAWLVLSIKNRSL